MIEILKKVDWKYKILIFIMLISLIVSISTLAFGYFSVDRIPEGKDNVIISGTMSLEYDDVNEINVSNLIPGSVVTKNFKVKNNGNVSTTYDVYLSEIINTFSMKSDLVYEVISTKGCEKEETIAPSHVGDDSKIISSCQIAPNVTHEYSLKITFKETDQKQNSNRGRLFQAKLSINEYHDIFVAKILDTNQTLANVEVLKMSNLNVGDTVTTRGYHVENDGGAASYLIESKSNQNVDGGKYIELDNGNVAKLIYDDVISLKQYGAKGNGVDDDSISAGNAITYLGDNETLYVPEGDFVISAQLTYAGKHHTKVIGTGKNSRFIAALNYGSERERMIFALYNNDDVIFSNVAIDGNLENNPDCAIHLLDVWGGTNITLDECFLQENKWEAFRLIDGTANITVSNTNFRNTDCCIIAMGSGDVDNLVVENNHVEGHQNSEPVSLYGTGQYSNIYINNNVILNKKFACALYLGSFHGGTDGVINIHNVVITNNYIRNFSAGIEVRHAENVLIENNDIDNGDLLNDDGTAANGITIHEVNNIEIKNNELNKIKAFGMRLSNLSNANIEGNTIKDSGYVNINYFFVMVEGNNSNFNFHNNTLIREDDSLYQFLMAVHGDGSNNVKYVDNTFTNGRLRLWGDSSNMYVENCGNVFDQGTNNTIINN